MPSKNDLLPLYAAVQEQMKTAEEVRLAKERLKELELQYEKAERITHDVLENIYGNERGEANGKCVVVLNNGERYLASIEWDDKENGNIVDVSEVD